MRTAHCSNFLRCHPARVSRCSLWNCVQGACNHARTHARTHAHTHTDTHTCQHRRRGMPVAGDREPDGVAKSSGPTRTARPPKHWCTPPPREPTTPPLPRRGTARYQHSCHSRKASVHAAGIGVCDRVHPWRSCVRARSKCPSSWQLLLSLAATAQLWKKTARRTHGNACVRPYRWWRGALHIPRATGCCTVRSACSERAGASADLHGWPTR